MRQAPVGYPYRIFCGHVETMRRVAEHGARALNTKTHKWQVVDKTAKYLVVEDNVGNGAADLFSNLDLRKMAKDRGMII